MYTFGAGAYGQFAAREKKDAFSTAHAPFSDFSEIAALWHGRVVPEESFLATIGDDAEYPDNEADGGGGLIPVSNNSQPPQHQKQKAAAGAKSSDPLEGLEPGVDMDIDDPRTELLYSPFRDSICASNTCALWGRRVAEVKLSANVAVARSEFGELFVWGGTSQWCKWWERGTMKGKQDMLEALLTLPIVMLRILFLFDDLGFFLASSYVCLLNGCALTALRLPPRADFNLNH